MKNIFSIILLTLFLLILPNVYALSVTDCGTLNAENEVYVLSNNITNNYGTCITIEANNITLDCNNNKISFGQYFIFRNTTRIIMFYDYGSRILKFLCQLNGRI